MPHATSRAMSEYSVDFPHKNTSRTNWTISLPHLLRKMFGRFFEWNINGTKESERNVMALYYCKPCSSREWLKDIDLFSCRLVHRQNQNSSKDETQATAGNCSASIVLNFACNYCLQLHSVWPYPFTLRRLNTLDWTRSLFIIDLCISIRTNIVLCFVRWICSWMWMQASQRIYFVTSACSSAFENISMKP